MSDEVQHNPKSPKTDVTDQSFIFGDSPPRHKIEAWEGDADADFLTDAGEMALANLHFGSIEQTDLTKSETAASAPDESLPQVPSGLSDSAVSVEILENESGAQIGTLTSFDPAAPEAFSYTVSDSRFELINGNLQLVEGVSLNFEEAATVDVTVSAVDGDGNTISELFVIDVIDVNDAPSDLALDGSTVSENDAGATVGTLSSFDPDAGDSVTYTVSDARFEVVDGELRLADGVTLNHEEAASIEVTVTATDSGGLETSESFEIVVADVNEGPSDLALDGNTVSENDAGATVGTLSSFDPDAGDSVTYTVSDARFEVVDGELRLADGVSLNHEEAASIEVTVTATDSGGLETSESFEIVVADVNEGPSDLALDGNTISENDAGATVGTLSSFDPDAGDSVTYTVSDDRFEVVDGELRLADGVSLNHEEAASIEVTVTATDAGGLSTEEAFTIDVADVNEGPSDLALDSNTVSENDAGATVGTLSSFDPDAGDSVTYTVSDDRFEVVDGELRLAEGVSLNHEEAASIEVTVTATDAGGLSTEEAFTIDVADVNEGPNDLALDGNTVSENDGGATVGTLSSFDPDAGDSVTYTVSDDRFEVVDGELRLADGVSLNHEEAASIEVTVTATDSGGLETSESFEIVVADVNEGPSDLALDGNTISENDAGATVGTLSSFDPDAGDSVTYTVSDDRFEVVDGELRLAEGVSLNHEEAASIEVTVTATDSGGLSSEEAFTIDVADVNEGPSDLALDGATVSENDAGATVGTLSSLDPDAGDSVTYTVSDARFEVVDGELRLAEGVSLNHEEAASIEVTVTATDSGGLETSESFEIVVADVNEGPSDLALDGNTISENDAGATVGTLSSFDPDAGDSVTYTVSDERFEVVDGELRLADGVSLNHEEAASIEVTVTATDSEGLSTEEAFTIDVTDVNEGPTDLALDGNTVSENDAGATVGTLSSFDPDAGDSVTYTVSDDRFEVVDGELRLADGVSLNHEEAASIEVTVTATDSGGLESSESFEITVADVNEVPSDLALDGATVSENDAGATVGTLSSFDPDAGDSVTYTVSDDRFEVVDGELRLADGVSLNHEEAASIEVTVTATDSEGLSTEEAFTIDVSDVNEGPSDLALDGNTVSENDAGATVGTLSSFDPDAGDSVTYTVSDERFEVVDGELRLAEGVSLNHEEAASIEVTVTATDSGGLSTEEAFTIDVADVNEGPSDLALDGNTISENDAGATVGTLSSFDPDAGDSVTYTVSDDRFEVVDGELRLADGVSLNHEEAASIEVTVTATDAGGLSTEEAFTIDVADVNEGPSDLALDGATVSENDAGATVGTLSSFDPDAGDSVTYTVSDDRFEVVDGELRLAEGVSLNHEEAASIEVTVTATDAGGLSTEEAFTIDVTDVNEAPSDLALDSSSENLISGGSFEGQSVSTGGWRGFGSDPTGTWDSANGIEVWDNLWGTEAADGNQFLELDYTSAADAISQTVSTEAGQVYTLSLDVRARAEGADTDSIEIYWNGELIDIVDPGSTDWETVSFDVVGTGGEDVLEFREVDDQSNGLGAHMDNISLIEVPLTLAENSEGVTIGTLSSFDPDAGDTVTYTVSDDRFEVVDGELRLADGVSLNHEEAASIEVTVTATDSGGLETSESFEIVVADVNEGPSDLALDGNTISENDAGATVGTLSSFDPDAGDSVTYTVSDDRFEVVDGELRLADGVSLNHEEAASIEVTVTATDSGGLETSESFEITVADVSEGPSDLALDGNTVSENDAGATVGTLSSFDPDAGDSVTYTVSDDRFEVVDGELRLADGVSLNHEEAASIEVTVTATDSEGLSTQEAFTIDVVDVNEGPSDLALDGNTVSENDAGATVGTLSSFDPDASDTMTYTVSDDRFEVVDGELRLAEGVSLNHEEAASIEVTVTATDSGGLETSESFEITVADVNEGPTDLALDGNTVSENDAGATVGTLSSFDPDAGDSVTYSVSDDRFEVVDGELRLADGVSLNHEDAASLDVTVTATDADGLTSEEAFTIDVSDVNEGPSDLALDDTTVAENDTGATVGTLSSFDPDAGDSVSYTVSDDRFEIVDGELRLADGVSLNHEEAASIELTVTATDSEGLSTQEAFTIDVADVNEGPSDLTLTPQTGMVESDFSAADGHSGSSIQNLGLETDAIVFTMSFTTADDVSSIQTLFETGGSVYGTNVVIEGGMLHIYAGEGNDLELSVPIEGNTNYSFALELDTESDTIRVLLSDDLPLSEMTAENSLVASLDDWGDRDYTGSNQMGVGDVAGGSTQGNIGGAFEGEIESPGLQVFSDSKFEDVFTEVGIEENAEGAVIGTLSSFDPDAGDTVTYTVSDDRFEVVEGEVRLVDGVSLDHEEAASIELTITATDSGGLTVSESFTFDVLDVNEGPSDLSLSANTILENSTEGVVGTVNVTDQDVGDTHSFSLVDNAGQPFAIDAETGEISLISPGVPEGSVLHIDASNTDSLTENGGVSGISDLSGTGNTIQQSNADERPEFTNDGPFGGPGLQFDGVNDHLDISDSSEMNLSSQSERSFALTIQTGEDVESRQVIYEEGGTVNGFNFYIDDGQLYMGAWSEGTGWDFEAITVDVEPGESYSILTVYDGSSNTYTAFVNGEEVGSVEVGDTMAAHSGDIGLGGIAQHTVFHDGDSSANNGFNFEGSVGEFVVFNDALDNADITALDMEMRGLEPDIDFETQSSYDVTVEVTDAAGETYQEVVTINVADVEVGVNESAENLIENGSFEDTSTSTTTGWGETATTIDGWASETGDNFEMVNGGYGGVDATDGNYWLDGDETGANMHITQQVDGVKEGVEYELSFDAADRSSDGAMEVYWGGELVATVDPDSTDMESFSFNVTGGAGDGSDTLEFKEVGSEDNVGVSLDNVSLVETSLTVTGSDGDDTLKGGVTDDQIFGGAGDDIFIYEADGGSDSFDGGAGWTDTLDLSNALGDDAVFGEDWTLVLTEGEIVNENADSLELTDDAAGYIQLENGETIDFTDVEQIGF